VLFLAKGDINTGKGKRRRIDVLFFWATSPSLAQMVSFLKLLFNVLVCAFGLRCCRFAGLHFLSFAWFVVDTGFLLCQHRVLEMTSRFPGLSWRPFAVGGEGKGGWLREVKWAHLSS
jgi:hypothetical protein